MLHGDLSQSGDAPAAPLGRVPRRARSGRFTRQGAWPPSNWLFDLRTMPFGHLFSWAATLFVTSIWIRTLMFECEFQYALVFGESGRCCTPTLARVRVVAGRRINTPLP